MKETMPEVLEQFLTNLEDEDAENVWSYLDVTPYVESEIIDTICDTHPNLASRYS
jgi:hypothetical protein